MGSPLWLREMALARSGGYCEVTGLSVDGTFVLHHRKLVSQGGLDVIENVLVVVSRGHLLAHKSPKKSYETGWLVPRWDNPATARLTRPNGKIVTLTPEGTYE